MGKRWPPDTKDACLAAVEGGIPYEEIESTYGVPAGTVKSWAHRAEVTHGALQPNPQPRARAKRALTFEELGPEARLKLPSIVENSLEKALNAERGTDAYNFLRAVQVAGEICPELLTGIKGTDDGSGRKKRRDQLAGVVKSRGLGSNRTPVSGKPGGSDS